MDKGSGIGVGSASIILVFAVLCLSVFSLITFVVSGNTKSLVDAEAELVTNYYDADIRAELILAEILESWDLPDIILGVEIDKQWDMERDAEIVQYQCPLGDSSKSLYVRLALYWDSYEILSWRMRDTDEWTTDDGLNVWLGPDDESSAWFGLDIET